MKKQFKDTKVGKFLASKGFDNVLETVGSMVPGVAILDQVKDMVLGKDSKRIMTPEDQAHFLELMKLEQQELDSRLKDTADARSRQVELAKAGKKDIMHAVVTCFFLACFAALMVKHLFFPSPETSSLNDLEMTLRDICFMIATFFFGSSMGSRRKTEIMKTSNESN